MIGEYIALYVRHQNAIAVAFIILPVFAIAYRRRKNLDLGGVVSAGTYGAGVQTGILLILAAGAPEVIAQIQFPAQVAVWGALSIVYAFQGLMKLWTVSGNNDS